MFGLGFSEWVVIGIVIIIFVKPEDIPTLFRTIGKYYQKYLKFYHRMMNELTEVNDSFIKSDDKKI